MNFAQPINVLSMKGDDGGVVYTFGDQIVRGIKNFVNGIKTPSVTASVSDLTLSAVGSGTATLQSTSGSVTIGSGLNTTLVSLNTTTIDAIGLLALESSSDNVNLTAGNSVNVTATNGMTLSSTNTTGDINLTSGDNINLTANANNGIIALTATGSSSDINLTANSINGDITTSAYTTTLDGTDLNINQSFIYRLGSLQPNISIYAIQGQLANPLGSWTTCTLNYSIGAILTAGDTQFFQFPYKVLCCWASVSFDSRAFNGFTNRQIDFRFQNLSGVTLVQSNQSPALANADRACVCTFNGNSVAANTAITPQFRWTGTGSLSDAKRFVVHFYFQQA
jgi:hypothetical protein